MIDNNLINYCKLFNFQYNISLNLYKLNDCQKVINHLSREEIDPTDKKFWYYDSPSKKCSIENYQMPKRL